jgi:hypothetical protein
MENMRTKVRSQDNIDFFLLEKIKFILFTKLLQVVTNNYKHYNSIGAELQPNLSIFFSGSFML